ncbi:MAG: hypothetical protein M0P49_00825 [Bacilli bacterium]|nr:hypothetical protein [Bacilli bacterium]
MPIIGDRKNTKVGKGYAKDPIAKLTAAFIETAQSILNESGIDVFSEGSKTLMISPATEALRNFFVEGSADRQSMDAEAYNDHVEMMNELFINDKQGILEYAPVGSFNPVIGMTFPLHKNILMNNVFEQAIPKVVARDPKFTITMETRMLVKPDGTEIDMFKDQNLMTAAINSTNEFIKTTMTLPEVGTTNVLQTTFSTINAYDSLSIETYISDVAVAVTYDVGEVLPSGVAATSETAGVVNTFLPVNLKFAPGYGEYERTLMEPVVGVIKVVTNKTTGATRDVAVNDIIQAAFHKNRFYINSLKGDVLQVKVNGRLDTSNAMLETCKVKWSAKTVIEEIPAAIPINTPISPEEVKDIGALYQVNQLSKIMSLFKIVLGNYKDDMIKTSLDSSFGLMPTASKLSANFDFAPRSGYALDHVEWRHKTFMDALDTHITKLMQVLNDPNMTITVFGNPDLVRKITPTEYTYQSPSSIGPVELDFVRTITTSDKRTYQFIGSDKLRDSYELVIVLCPRNTERIVYRVYDYQMYVSNEIRNSANPALPAIHAFERWKFVEYQPVQGRITILNPSGIAED